MTFYVFLRCAHVFSNTARCCCCCCAIFSAHFFWTVKISEKSHRCLIDRRFVSFIAGPFIHLKFVTYCLLPFFIILILNVLIVARLRWTPVSLRSGLAGSNPTVSIGLETSVVMSQTDGGVASTVRLANTPASASTSAVALRQRRQVRAAQWLSLIHI